MVASSCQGGWGVGAGCVCECVLWYWKGYHVDAGKFHIYKYVVIYSWYAALMTANKPETH